MQVLMFSSKTAPFLWMKDTAIDKEQSDISYVSLALSLLCVILYISGLSLFLRLILLEVTGAYQSVISRGESIPRTSRKSHFYRDTQPSPLTFTPMGHSQWPISLTPSWCDKLKVFYFILYLLIWTDLRWVDCFCLMRWRNCCALLSE